LYAVTGVQTCALPISILFALFGMVGTFVRAYYTYTGLIEQQERERRPWEHKW